MSDESHTLQPADWIVTNANHWVYANTGLTNGSVLPGFVYYEWDSFVNNAVTPPGITVLASSVVPNNVIPGSRHEATVHERGRPLCSLPARCTTISTFRINRRWPKWRKIF